MKIHRKCAIVLFLLAGAGLGQAPPDPQGKQTSARLAEAVRLYRSGQFDLAAAEYKAILQAEPASGDAHAGLVRVYLKQEDVRRASEQALAGLKADPLSPSIRTALGEVYFRQGRIEEADQQFVNVVNTGAADARAYLGLARVRQAASMRRLARDAIETAYKLDPADPDIQELRMGPLKLPQQIEALERYLATPTGGDAEDRRRMQQHLGLLKEMQKHPGRPCTLVRAPASSETALVPIAIGPFHMSGFGLNVKVNGQDSRLLLDTGASGFTINKKLADKARIALLAPAAIAGIGDEGSRSGYWGHAESIRIADLEFRDCLVEVSPKIPSSADGLIGADVFSDYLVSVDFPRQKLKLTELPRRPGKNQGVALDTENREASDFPEELQDRYIAPEMRSYTRIFRFGHSLLIPTRIGNAPPKLFLIDTGSVRNYISPEAARETTKVHRDPDEQVRGLSGDVDKVHSADKVVFQFSHFRQESQELVAFDLSDVSRQTGTEVSGILGFVTLRLFEIKIDYRDGLVDFVLDKKDQRH